MARINVRDYGAKGDGETDDTAAIQAAVNAASAVTIRIPVKVEVAPLTFFVHGVPIAKGRPRSLKSGGPTYTPPETVAWERTVATYARQALAKAQWRGPSDACFAVRADFHLPTGHRKDVDNLAKSAIDACNKLIWKDDSQVADLRVKRFLRSKVPGVWVRATIIEEPVSI